MIRGNVLDERARKRTRVDDRCPLIRQVRAVEEERGVVEWQGSTEPRVDQAAIEVGLVDGKRLPRIQRGISIGHREIAAEAAA